jgi:hypothetical protein
MPTQAKLIAIRLLKAKLVWNGARFVLMDAQHIQKMLPRIRNAGRIILKRGAS